MQRGIGVTRWVASLALFGALVACSSNNFDYVTPEAVERQALWNDTSDEGLIGGGTRAVHLYRLEPGSEVASVSIEVCQLNSRDYETVSHEGQGLWATCTFDSDQGSVWVGKATGFAEIRPSLATISSCQKYRCDERSMVIVTQQD